MSRIENYSPVAVSQTEAPPATNTAEIQTEPASQLPVEQAAASNPTAAAESKWSMDFSAGLLMQSLQNALGGIFGGQESVPIAPGTPPAPVDSVTPNPNLVLPESTAHRLASDITSVFETGKVEGDPGAVQNLDSGIISFGKHQCTLSSKEDSLEKVLDRYIELAPDSENAKKLEGFMEKVRNKDESLRNDPEFIQLLKDTGSDPLMEKAQDQVFDEMYWDPAMKSAENAGVESNLGKALFYDTAVNSGPDGLNKILERTQAKLEGKDPKPTEQEFLKAFAEERTKYIKEAADRCRTNGDPTTADMLDHVASDWRMDYWNKWIDAGNLNLEGDFTIYKQTIHGG